MQMNAKDTHSLMLSLIKWKRSRGWRRLGALMSNSFHCVFYSVTKKHHIDLIMFEHFEREECPSHPLMFICTPWCFSKVPAIHQRFIFKRNPALDEVICSKWGPSIQPKHLSWSVVSCHTWKCQCVTINVYWQNIHIITTEMALSMPTRSTVFMLMIHFKLLKIRGTIVSVWLTVHAQKIQF